jgi:hypothetical protein
MRCCCLIVSLMLGAVCPATAQVTSTAIPAADTFVTSATPAGNFGAAGALAVAAPALPKGEFRSFLRFDTLPLKAAFDSALGPGNWTVQSVTLRLGAAPPNNPVFNGNGAGPGGTNVNTPGTFTASWIADDAWIEGTGSTGAPGAAGVRFNHLPALTGAQSLGAFDFGGGTSGTNTYGLTLSAGLLSDLNTGGLLSIQLSPSAGETALSYTLNSRTAGNPPLLSVTAIPEPTALALPAALLPVLRRAGRRRAA